MGVDTRIRVKCQAMSTRPLHFEQALKGTMPSSCGNGFKVEGVGEELDLEPTFFYPFWVNGHNFKPYFSFGPRKGRL